ncbi:MAG: hypothetical protein WAW27_14580 [Chitinophagaceae bacterium]
MSIQIRPCKILYSPNNLDQEFPRQRPKPNSNANVRTSQQTTIKRDCVADPGGNLLITKYMYNPNRRTNEMVEI